MLACDQKQCTRPAITLTTTTSAFNDTNSRKWVKTPIYFFYWCCHLYYPLNTCCQDAVLLMVRTVLCVSWVSGCCMAPIGMRNQICILPTFEVGSDSRLLLPALQLLKLIFDPNLHHLRNKKSYFKVLFWIMLRLGLQKPVEVTKWRKNNFLACLTWMVRHNRFADFLSNDNSLADTEYRIR